MRSSSFEERSTTGILSEGPPCSKIDERGWREETFSGDPGGSGYPDRDGGGIAWRRRAHFRGRARALGSPLVFHYCQVEKGGGNP
jgi:hypothetical protein